MSWKQIHYLANSHDRLTLVSNAELGQLYGNENRATRSHRSYHRKIQHIGRYDVTLSTNAVAPQRNRLRNPIIGLQVDQLFCGL